MTTRAGVCSECGAEAAGRYACTGCGALLAAVAAGGRAPREDVARMLPAAHRVAALPEPAAEPPTAHPFVPAAVPAGSYLAPSAILPLLGAGRSGPAPARDRSAQGGSSGAGRGRLDARLDGVALTADATRSAIAAGAAVAAAGFLLPWAAVLSGAGLIGGYFTQWGLAGPGAWIVVGLLVGLAVAAAVGSRGRASLPIGEAAVILAALLVGLVWPYLFGVLGRSIGVWVAVAGALVLGVAGLLEMRSRHAPGRPPVL